MLNYFYRYWTKFCAHVFLRKAMQHHAFQGILANVRVLTLLKQYCKEGTSKANAAEFLRINVENKVYTERKLVSYQSNTTLMYA